MRKQLLLIPISILYLGLALSLDIYPNTTKVCTKNKIDSIEMYTNYYNKTLIVALDNEKLNCPRYKTTDEYVIYKCDVDKTFKDGVYKLVYLNKTVNICIDSEKPTITVSLQGNGLVINNSYCLLNRNIPLLIRATKKNGCCKEINISIYHNATLVDSGLNLVTLLPKEAGYYSIFARDKIGNENSRTIKVCLPENNPPKAKLIDYRIKNNTILAQFSLGDDSAVKQFGNCLKEPIVQGKVNCTLPKQETITLDAIDIYNNSKEYTFHFDVTPPKIDILYPEPKDGIIFLNLKDRKVELAVSNDAVKCWYTFNGERFNLPINEGTLTLLPSVSGIYKVYCEDNKGNVAEKDVNVVIDTVPPSLTIKDYGYAVDSKGIYAYIKFQTDPDAKVEVYKNGAYLGTYESEFKDYNVYVGQKYVYTLVPIDEAGNKGKAKEVVIYIKSDLKCKLNVDTVPSTEYTFTPNITLIINTEPKAFVIVSRGKQVVCSGNADAAGFYQCKATLLLGKNVFKIKSTDPTGDTNETQIVKYYGLARIYVPIPSQFLGEILTITDNNVLKTKGEVNYFGFYVNPEEIKVSVYADKELVCTNYEKPLCKKKNNYTYIIGTSVESVLRAYKANKIVMSFKYGDDTVNVTINPKDSTIKVGSYSIVLGGALLPFYYSTGQSGFYLFGIASFLALVTAYYDLRGSEIKIFEKISNILKNIRKTKSGPAKTKQGLETKPLLQRIKERIHKFIENLRKDLKNAKS